MLKSSLMKNLLFLLPMLIAFGIDSSAQSIAYTYPSVTFNRTIAYRPNGGYAASEMIGGPSGDLAIHFTIYNQTGGITVDRIIDEPFATDRNVDITYLPAQGQWLLTALYRKPSAGPAVGVLMVILSPTGSIVQQKVLYSNHSVLKSLFPLDATYDANRNVIVFCGTATPNSSKDEPDPGVTQQAFVATVNLNLSTANMKFYNTSVGSNTGDFDIANRVVVTQTGDYYVTGSVNVDKGLGHHVQGIRNMVVDEITLNPIWSAPVTCNRAFSQENSVDMLEMKNSQGVNEFVVLINSTDTTYNTVASYVTSKWWLLRVNPSNGSSLYNNAETLFPFSYWAGQGGQNICIDVAHSLQKGNNPYEVVVSGMKLPTINKVCHTMGYTSPWPMLGNTADGVPFMATLNMSIYPTTVVQHVEYNSVASLAIYSYWGTGSSGGLYLNNPFNLNYYVPNYLNKFVDRRGPGNPYGLITYVQSHTKYLDIISNTLNGCDDIVCNYSINEIVRPPVYKQVAATQITAPIIFEPGVETSKVYNYTSSDVCANGYYRNDNTTNVSEPELADTKIYPNPTSGLITIEFSSAQIGAGMTIHVQDLMGKTVAKFSSEIEGSKMEYQLPENLVNGIYILNVSSGNASKQVKLSLLK
jgi:hypothetical protein